MNLSETLHERRAGHDILLMAHIVIGYPSLSASLELVDAMVGAGVDLLELQIPFSEPMADGPVIVHANQQALKQGIKVEQCFDFAAKVTRRHKIPFLFMSYYNVLYKRGLEPFAKATADAGVVGTIVPDCPPEEGSEYVASMKRHDLHPIFIYSPSTPEARMRALGSAGSGMVYVVARKGVTGQDTQFSSELGTYLARCRAATKLPLAVGFGLKSKADVDFLVGKADIAVVGTQSLRVLDEHGIEAVAKWLSHLRDPSTARAATT